jgi:hypothetical protein
MTGNKQIARALAVTAVCLLLAAPSRAAVPAPARGAPKSQAQKGEPGKKTEAGRDAQTKGGSDDKGAAKGTERGGEEVVLDYPAVSTLRPRAPGEEQARGLLTEIECPAKGVILHVRVGERTLRLRSDDLARIKFTTYTTEVKGELDCGPRTPANHVLVTYRPAQGASAAADSAGPPARRAAARRAKGKRAPDKPPKVDGEAVAVDFIPKEWK